MTTKNKQRRQRRALERMIVSPYQHLGTNPTKEQVDRAVRLAKERERLIEASQK